MFQSHLKALENWGACAEAVYVTANLGGCILPSSHVFEYAMSCSCCYVN
jgi:hypothetical protein